jgi:hypothetical protein
MSDRYIYIVPMTEANRDPETLAWARKTGETVELIPHDETGAYDSEFFKTVKQALACARRYKKESFWKNAIVSIDG